MIIFHLLGIHFLADDSNVNNYFDYVLKKVFQSSHSIFWGLGLLQQINTFTSKYKYML